MAQPDNVLWKDDELRASVEGYLYLLRLEQNGIRCREGVANKLLRSGLVRRNEGSIRYRMRNISAVMLDKGAPILSAYSPAARVGSGVRARIGAILDSHPVLQDLVRAGHRPIGPKGRLPPTKTDLLQRLNTLRNDLDILERELVGIGHNKPPEPIEAVSLRKDDFEIAKSAVDDLSGEISKASPDRKVVENQTRVLTEVGLKIALWIGGRATKLVDSIIAAAAPVALLTAAALLPKLVDLARDVGKFVGLL